MKDKTVDRESISDVSVGQNELVVGHFDVIPKNAQRLASRHRGIISPQSPLKRAQPNAWKHRTPDEPLVGRLTVPAKPGEGRFQLLSVTAATLSVFPFIGVEAIGDFGMIKR